MPLVESITCLGQNAHWSSVRLVNRNWDLLPVWNLDGVKRPRSLWSNIFFSGAFTTYMGFMPLVPVFFVTLEVHSGVQRACKTRGSACWAQGAWGCLQWSTWWRRATDCHVTGECCHLFLLQNDWANHLPLPLGVQWWSVALHDLFQAKVTGAGPVGPILPARSRRCCAGTMWAPSRPVWPSSNLQSKETCKVPALRNSSVPSTSFCSARRCHGLSELWQQWLCKFSSEWLDLHPHRMASQCPNESSLGCRTLQFVPCLSGCGGQSARI